MQRRLPALDNAATPHITSIPFLREWVKVKLIDGPWKDVLVSAVGVSVLALVPIIKIDAVGAQFALPKVEIYQAIVEHLEATDRIADAVDCFYQMTSELGEKIDLEWVLGKWSCISSAPLLIYRFCQTLGGGILPRNWRIWEIQQQLRSKTTRPSPSTRLHCLSSLPPHKAFS